MRVIPKERKAFLISIPRDYRVEIPGYGKRKVNAAFSLGGPGLAIKTISNYLGIPIHHYAVIDFQGFVKVVDAVGGVYINVEKRLYEPNSSRANLYPGYQKLNGSQALSYVRFRHDEEGDFGRIRRQQQFLKALATKLLEPSSIPKYPRIANLIAENVETDMSLSELIGLAKYFASSGGVKIESVMLPGAPKNIAGASYVVPDEAKVRIIVQAVFSENRMPTPDELIDPSTVAVKVFNGTKKPGLARAFAGYLRDLGFNVYGTRNADRTDYVITLIVYKPGHKEEADFLKKQIEIGEVVEAGEAHDKLLGSASVGLILGTDSLDIKEIQERLR
jgi:LCP family protein required for cell wall assembly